MAAAFSSDGEAVLRRTLDPAAASPRGDKDEFYEVDRAAAFVRDGGFHKVCGGGGAGTESLLSSSSHPVLPSGRPAVPRCAAGGCGGRGGPDGGGDGSRDVRAGRHHVWQVGVTGRRSRIAPFGGHSVSPTDASGSPRSCCVDEVAAEHASAEAVVHYGPACLSPCRKLPVLHVFGRQPLDVGHCAEVFRDLYPDRHSRVVVLSDVVYAHAMGECCVGGRESSEGAPRYHHFCPLLISSPADKRALTFHSYFSLSLGELQKQLCHEYPNIIFSQVVYGDPPSPTLPGEVRQFGRRFHMEAAEELQDCSMFYVGAEGLALTSFMLTWNCCPFSSFDPATGHGRRETLNVNRALMRRLYLVERARDARVVGILVGTLGVAGYLDVLQHLRQLVRRAGKRSYTLCVGKPNPAKLANFLEVDIFVLVACAQNSLLDSSDYYRPIVTPYELELACNPAREWTGNYLTDFRDLLPGNS